MATVANMPTATAATIRKPKRMISPCLVRRRYRRGVNRSFSKDMSFRCNNYQLLPVGMTDLFDHSVLGTDLLSDFPAHAEFVRAAEHGCAVEVAPGVERHAATRIAAIGAGGEIVQIFIG